MNLSNLQEIVKDKGAYCSAVQGGHRVRQDLATKQQPNQDTVDNNQ